MKRNHVALVVLISVPSALFAACGGGDDQSSTQVATGTGGSTSTTSTESGTGGHGGSILGDAGMCITNADCNGGVCVDGVCCDNAQNVCAGTCCKPGSVCLFDKCVLPGKDCHTNSDCQPGQYCETALGNNPDGGPGDAGMSDSGMCTQPLPLEGKCLDLPPICDKDAGANPADAGCVDPCEYHPPVGQLEAVAKWSWGPNAVHKPNFIDVWSTPTVGRIYDGNCDGQVNELDSPDVVFVSGRGIDMTTGLGTCCQCTGQAVSACKTGVLRMLDGHTGLEIWSLDAVDANSVGFAGLSTAIGDVDGDGQMDILAMTGEGHIAMVSAAGQVMRVSDKPVPGNAPAGFGWGGGIALADMDHDGFPEIAYGATVFSTQNNAITLLWTGAAGVAGSSTTALSTFVDLDLAADNHLELLAGNTAYKADGSILWNRNDLPDGFPAIGDFNLDGKPEVVLVASGNIYILEGATGKTIFGPVALPGTGTGGPPTVADFDGDGKPEIGVAMATFYSMLKPDYNAMKLNVVWQTPNHDLSSSVTGSSVFDFEGDGKAEVVYGDECFLWVFDGQTGQVRFAAPHTSFTATEASVVADVDGDGHAEILMIANGADPSANGWKCMDAANNPTTVNGVKWTPGNQLGKAYRGLTAFGDKASSWVGTRTLWSEHTYHVSNICDDRDTACDPPNVYGSVPKTEKRNWTLPWLNDFRQNVQDKGLFDAPDAVVSLDVQCVDPVVVYPSVRNIGLSSLPAGVQVDVFKQTAMGDVKVGTGNTTHVLFPGQTEGLSVMAAGSTKTDTFIARIVNDPMMPQFHECRTDNDDSAPVKANCVN